MGEHRRGTGLCALALVAATLPLATSAAGADRSGETTLVVSGLLETVVVDDFDHGRARTETTVSSRPLTTSVVSPLRSAAGADVASGNVAASSTRAHRPVPRLCSPMSFPLAGVWGHAAHPSMRLALPCHRPAGQVSLRCTP